MFQKLKTVSTPMTPSAVFLFLFLPFFLSSCEREVAENCQNNENTGHGVASSVPQKSKFQNTKILNPNSEPAVVTAKAVMVDISGTQDLAIVQNEILIFDADKAVEYYSSAGGSSEDQIAYKKEAVRMQKEVFLRGGKLEEFQMGDVLLSPISDSVRPKTCWLFHEVNKNNDSLATVCLNVLLGVQKFTKNTNGINYRTFDIVESGNLSVSNLSVSVSGDHIESSDPLHMVKILETEEVNFNANALKENSAVSDSLVNGICVSDTKIRLAQIENLCYKLPTGNYEFAVSGMFEDLPFRKNLKFSVMVIRE